jgi:hypothetical protein
MNASRSLIVLADRCRPAAVLALLVGGALCASIAACGGAAQVTATDPAAIPPSPSLTGDYDGDDEYHADPRRKDADNDDSNAPKDKDNDTDASGGGPFDADDHAMLHFGHLANPAEWRAIAALMRRYFAAADAQDGAAACAMFAPALVRSTSTMLGGATDIARYLRGQPTCAGLMARMFAHYHREIAAHAARLSVSRVRVQLNEGLVGLSFGTLPEAELRVQRVGGVWKVENQLDTELP